MAQEIVISREDAMALLEDIVAHVSIGKFCECSTCRAWRNLRAQLHPPPASDGDRLREATEIIEGFWSTPLWDRVRKFRAGIDKPKETL